MPNLGKITLTWHLEKNIEMQNHDGLKKKIHIHYSHPNINKSSP